ncbi:MAG: hypothetical protein EXQ67_05930 [Thermoleophilia bacterium]|nr:hypothetical protein [Thermoleophilia bacterium]
MRRGQATIEFLILLGVAIAVTAFIVFAARSDGASYAARIAKAIPGHQPERRDDRWALRSDSYGPLLRRYTPELVLERDRYGEDAAMPVDPAVCRKPWCAAFGTGRAAVFTHVVRRAGGVVGGVLQPGVTYLEYWFYYPDSKTLHFPVAELQGFHRDDWEGLIVRIPDRGSPVGRVTSHQGLVGVVSGWSVGRGGIVVSREPGWFPLGPHPVVYRASGSHANGFVRDGIDAPLDLWNGDLGRLPPSALQLIAADTVPSLRLRYDPAAVPPWHKQLWTNPESTSTGSSPQRPPTTQPQSRSPRDPRRT